MLDENGHVKLIDFGLSVEVKNEIEPLSPTGSFIYMAPEMIKEKTGGRHTDWWALGVLAYALLTGRTPWSTLTDKDILRREIQTMQISPPRRLSPPAGQLVCALMTQDYRKRLGTKKDSEIKKASFFQTIDFKKMEMGQTPAAFEPGKRCVSEQDHLNAMSAYNKTLNNNSEGNKSPDGSWFMGLPNASEYLL
jgi:serine/threonine kinase 32